jgi:hypothetical protein
LTGGPPFQGETAIEIVTKQVMDPPPRVTDLRPEVPAGLADLVGRMLAKDPAERPQTPREVAEALKAFARPAGKTTPPVVGGATPGAEELFATMTASPSLAAARRAAANRAWLPWKRLIPAAVAAGVVLLGVGLWPGVTRVPTPHGTIVLTVNEPGAEVLVDGNKVTVSRAGGVPVEITARPGQKLEVRKGGFNVYTRELTLHPGTREELTVTLERPPAPPASVVKPVPQPAVPSVPSPPQQQVNLLRNPGCEEPMNNGRIPGWTVVKGGAWFQRPGSTEPFEGKAYFSPGASDSEEKAVLRQDVDVSSLSADIDAGNARFEFKGRVRSYDQKNKDTSQIIVTYETGTGEIRARFESEKYEDAKQRRLIEDARTAPKGTRRVGVRLISRRNGGKQNNGYFDDLSLRALTVKLRKIEIKELP